MTQIVIDDLTPRVSYTVGGSSTTIFAVPFPFFSDSDLRVYVDEELQTLTTDYTVTGEGVSEGGTVTLVSGITNATVTIARHVPIERTTDFPVSGALRTDSLNSELDRIIAICQQLSDQIERSVRLADGDPSVGLEMPPASERAGGTLAFDSEGGLLISGGVADSIATSSFMATVLDDADAAAALATLGAEAAFTDASAKTVTGVNGGAARTLVQHLATLPDSKITVNGTGAVARDLKSRFDEVINLLDFGGVNDGTTDNVAALNAAVTEALTRGDEACIYVPPGDYLFSAGVVLNPGATRLAVVGEGAEVTRFLFTDLDSEWLQIGVRGATKHYGFTMRGISLYEQGGVATGGAAIRVRNAQRLLFQDIYVQNTYKGWELGDPTVNDDVVDITLLGCDGYGGTTDTAWIDLQSGAILSIVGAGKFNGNGAGFLIGQTNPTYNWDGLTVESITGEQWARFLHIVGAGVSNARIHGNIVDRSLDHWIFATPVTNLFNFSVIGNLCQGRATANTTSGIFISEAAGGAVQGVTIANNHFWQLGGTVITFGDGCRGVVVSGNNIWDCGYDAGATRALIRIGASTTATVIGNTGDVISTSGYDYGIQWDGSGTSRVSSGNNWNAEGTAAETGTP